MHRIFTAIAALSLVLGLLLGFAGSASAVVAGYDSSYFGESAFLNLSTGQSGQFAVGFNNTGSTGWVKGSGSQVDLQVCLANKTTCGVASPNAAWANNWLSATAYATATTDYVGPGQTGWFVYNITAPATSAGLTARFNGDLALRATGQQVHPQGYYQDASVAGTPPPGGGGGAAVPSAVTSVSAANLREITIKFNQAMAQTGAASVNDGTYTLSGGLCVDNVRVIDAQTVIATVGRQVGAVVCGTGNGGHMDGTATTFMTNNGTYTLTVANLATAGFQLTGTSSTTFTVSDSTSPTATAPVIIGAYSFYLVFSEPMDPTTTNNGITFDSQQVCSGTTAIAPDCNGGIGNLHWEDRAGGDCSTGGLGNNGCFEVLRVDFNKATQPAAGNHVLDIRDATDAANNKISPNPTTFTVNLSGSSDNVAPTATSLAIDVTGNTFRLNLTFSEAMAITQNGYSTTDSINCITTCSGTSGTNFILRNPDGTPATTGGSSNSGPALTISAAQPNTDSQLSTASPNRFQLKRIRLHLAPVGADNGSGATTTPSLRPNTAYTLEIINVKDENLNSLAPGTIKTFSWAGDSAAPTAPHPAYLTNTQLRVDYSELINSGTTGNLFGGCTNACDRARYSSPNSTFNTWLGTLTQPGAVDFNADGVIFTNTAPLTNGTYELDISGVVDPFGNIISPNPTVMSVTVGTTTKPTLVCAGFGGTGPNCTNTGTNANTNATTASQFSVRYSSQMSGGVSGSTSAGNPSNYSIDNGTFGALCTAGSPTITAGPVAADGSQAWTLACSGTGGWSAAGTHTVTVKDVQDLSANSIDPNPSTRAFTNP